MAVQIEAELAEMTAGDKVTLRFLRTGSQCNSSLSPYCRYGASTLSVPPKGRREGWMEGGRDVCTIQRLRKGLVLRASDAMCGTELAYGAMGCA
eukprot:2618050-Rhodomonas_salina.1